MWRGHERALQPKQQRFSLATHVFLLERIAEVFEMVAGYAGGVLRAIVQVSERFERRRWAAVVKAGNRGRISSDR
jgi:hypothetical protein